MADVSPGEVVKDDNGRQGEVVEVTDDMIAVQHGLVRSEMSPSTFEDIYGEDTPAYRIEKTRQGEDESVTFERVVQQGGVINTAEVEEVRILEEVGE